ncbi:MAG TPA: fasciclin domain-containing protein [Gaiellaceae bacterium]|nr:fasciclin domain-containing protein [Gaiellaceae bacterium]
MKARIAIFLGAVVATASLAVGATAAPSEPSAQSATIVGIAAGDKRFSTLVALVKQAGLVKTLNSKGPFTVFAPTNTAFVALKKAAPDTYEAVTTDKALLTKVLTYHVLAKRVPSAAAVAAANKQASVKTVQGETIKLSLQNGKLTLNGSSRVIVADVKASNGVVHAINAVLVPPSLS